MYKKILVPLDGSRMGECSLEQAKTIALGCHVPEVTLLAVVEPAEQSVPFLWGGAGEAQLQDAAQIEKDKVNLAKMNKSARTAAGDYLKKTAGALIKEGVSIKTAVIAGKAADAILDYAGKNGADIIIMSTHGHGGKSRWDFGKVTDRIIRASPIPVIVASPPGCRD